jgi:hypothetical protein
MGRLYLYIQFQAELRSLILGCAHSRASKIYEVLPPKDLGKCLFGRPREIKTLSGSNKMHNARP